AAGPGAANSSEADAASITAGAAAVNPRARKSEKASVHRAGSRVIMSGSFESIIAARERERMSFKVAFIGAGSIGFTRNLLRDLLTSPEFPDIEIAFTDINERNLEPVTRLCQRDIDENGLNIRIESTTDRRRALQGARYVFVTVRVGGLEAF